MGALRARVWPDSIFVGSIAVVGDIGDFPIEGERRVAWQLQALRISDDLSPPASGHSLLAN